MNDGRLGPTMPPPVRVSVVLPTFNERDALSLFYPELAPVLTALDAEAIIVDDGSPDGTAAIARSLPGPPPPEVLERPGERGLGAAVLAGFARARGEVLVVLDADGSHPPEVLPRLVDAVTSGGAEFALASRWVRGGSAPGLSLRRWLVSTFARLLARPLVDVRDPMSGAFAVRRSVLDRAALAPIGYKIALEILVKCRPSPSVEIPMTFRPRLGGVSKMGSQEVGNYVRHLARLYLYRRRGASRASRTR
jgi:dolichol-phosphate mannosyltransferase